MSEKKKYLVYLAILILFILIRTYDSGSDISNSDAIRWYKRSNSFLTALRTNNFKSTYQNYQPGVTIMWLNSALLFTTQKYYALISPEKAPTYTLENTGWFVKFNRWSVGLLVLIYAILLLIQLHLLTRIFSLKTSITYGIFLTLEPYFIGIDRWFHLTSMETYFGFTALLLVMYWVKNRQFKFLTISAMFFSLSVLSKVTTLVLLPFFVFAIYYYSRNIKLIFYYLLTLTLSIFFLFPALHVDFVGVTGKILNSIVSATTNNTSRSYFYYFLILLVKTSPVSLIFFILSFTKIKEFAKNRDFKILFAYLIYYFLLLSIARKKIDRYALVFFPPLLLISAYYVSHLSDKVFKAVLGMVLIIFIIVVYMYHPVYSAYYSPIFGGTSGALKLGAYDNSGEYMAQAANYLNSKGRNINTYVPENVDTFFYFYKGKLLRKYSLDSDYFVISKDSNRREIFDSRCPNLETTFGPKGSAVVFVYRCR